MFIYSKMSIYFTGKIYAIKCNDTDDVYIGSTINILEKRLDGHKKNMKRYNEGKCGYTSSFEIIKYDNAYIELLEAYPCYSKMELCRKEGEYIQNMECVNKCRPCITDEEKKEYGKEYYEANTEKVLQRQKGYYEANKEQVLQRQKQKYTCRCGSNIRIDGKIEHERSKKHQVYINSL